MDLIVGITIGIVIGIGLTIFFIDRFYFIPVIGAKYISKYGHKIVTVISFYEYSVYYELDGREYNIPRTDFCRSFKEYE